MLSTDIIESSAQSCITDVAFNWHGTRMAVCSNNMVDLFEQNQEKHWIKEDCGIELDESEMIQRISWAHPEFGQVLCVSTSNVITVWECKCSDNGVQWFKRGCISEPRHLVINDVKFSPSFSGMGKSRALDLAYCTDSGYLKIKRCKDANLLKDWETQIELPSKYQFTCLAWNVSNKSSIKDTSKFKETTMIAVGTMENSAKSSKGEVQLYEYDMNKDTYVFTVNIANNLNSRVHDIAFAPNPGRDFHTIAIASSDLQVIDFKLSDIGIIKKIQTDILEHNKVEVWKLSWSILGTILCTTGDDGLIKLWKKNNKWECVYTKSIKWNGMPM